MKKKFETVVKHLIGTRQWIGGAAGVNVSGQFAPEGASDAEVARNLNAAFLILLSGESGHWNLEVKSYFDRRGKEERWAFTVASYRRALGLIHDEIGRRCYYDPSFAGELESLYDWIIDPVKKQRRPETLEKIWKVFFPEACGIVKGRKEKVEKLREKRKIRITRLNRKPLENIARELLFTSNVLITVPPVEEAVKGLEISLMLREKLADIHKEQQLFWYDHPIQIGVETGKNEAVHGLLGLDRAVAFEKERGTIDAGDRADCLLSVSVTHDGLRKIAKEYLADELEKAGRLEHLNVFVLTEADSRTILREILVPAMAHYGLADDGGLEEVFGVDGEYGKHYTLLKAISAFWQVLVRPETRATFKFDVDQVFPQEELVEQTGASAFEHLQSPLWGAKGVDSDGHKVELGMIAGALVNQKDLASSLFTPDVAFPPLEVDGSQLIFFSGLPQALSTEAEMMMKYDSPEYDGVHSCIQRVHVTGGTNGILIDSLRKHRPFTPVFIGRAEDQAYLLSVLFEGNKRRLRYVHKPGLVMRHDKETFAGKAIEAAHVGKLIGDCVRILILSHYVRALPWEYRRIKEAIDPFTGSFVSGLPYTAVYLKLALRAASFFGKGTKETDREGAEFLALGIRRLDETVAGFADDPEALERSFHREKSRWDLYYDVLDKIEKGRKKEEPFALELERKARVLMEGFRVRRGETCPS